jgi:hypothetical protein
MKMENITPFQAVCFTVIITFGLAFLLIRKRKRTKHPVIDSDIQFIGSTFIQDVKKEK